MNDLRILYILTWIQSDKTRFLKNKTVCAQLIETAKQIKIDWPLSATELSPFKIQGQIKQCL